MQSTRILTSVVLFVAIMICLAKLSEAEPMGTDFTYQGRLNDAGSPADDLYDFQFKLYDDANTVTGNQVGSTIDINDLDVIEGYFTVELDFGGDVFNGDARWLEIGVRPGEFSDPCDYTTLSPRQEVTPVPYAIYAATAGGFQVPLELSGSISGAIIKGTNSNSDGTGIYGSASDANGTINYGGYFESSGVFGYGVYGEAKGTYGRGVYGEASGSGENYGGYFTSSSRTGRGIFGYASGEFGNGVVGSGGELGYGVSGSATNGGVLGEASGTNASGVTGRATYSGDETNYGGHFTARGRSGSGVYGKASGSSGSGVYGEATYTSIGNAENYGGYFVANGNPGRGVYGYASASSGINYGVYGKTNSPSGYAGFFEGDVMLSGTGKGIIFPDGSKQTTAATAGGLTLPYTGSTSTTGNAFSVTNTGSGRAVSGYATGSSGQGVHGVAYGPGKGVHGTASDVNGHGVEGFSMYGTGVYAESMYGTGLFAKSGQGIVGRGHAGDFQGEVIIRDFSSGDRIIQLGENPFHEQGGYMTMYSADGRETIRLDAEFDGGSRISTGVLRIMGGSDLSEQFEISGECGEVKPGMVVCIDPENPGNLVVSSKAYDRTVAGIVSGAGGVKPGMLMGQKGTKADGEHPVALTGRVYCWADASNGSIEPGDLLTTSDSDGYAMKVTDYTKAQGAILGKAMTRLAQGQGLVLVLVTLQ